MFYSVEVLDLLALIRSSLKELHCEAALFELHPEGPGTGLLGGVEVYAQRISDRTRLFALRVTWKRVDDVWEFNAQVGTHGSRVLSQNAEVLKMAVNLATKAALRE